MIFLILRQSSGEMCKRYHRFEKLPKPKVLIYHMCQNEIDHIRYEEKVQ